MHTSTNGYGNGVVLERYGKRHVILDKAAGKVASQIVEHATVTLSLRDENDKLRHELAERKARIEQLERVLEDHVRQYSASLKLWEQSSKREKNLLRGVEDAIGIDQVGTWYGRLWRRIWGEQTQKLRLVRTTYEM